MTNPSARISISEENVLLHPLYSGVESPPKKIWLEGSDAARALIARLPDDGFAVVGTRSPDPRAVYFLQSVIAKLRGTGLIILSGMARGIDTHAHEAALAAGLPTIAILGCGIDRTYPPENSRLRRRIVEAGGLILSEFDPGTNAHRGCFIQRNRLIAGYSRATWVVQSGYRSGALNTASWARKFHRNVYTTPAFPGDPSFLGNLSLLRDYEAKPVWDAGALTQDWLSLFSRIEENGRKPGTHSPLALLHEVERGYLEGRDLFTILDERHQRTGEPIGGMLAQIEAEARLPQG